MDKLLDNIDKLLNLSFELNFNSEKYSKGRPYIDGHLPISQHNDIIYDVYLENIDHWDFSMQINELRIENCSDYGNFKNRIEEYIRSTHKNIVEQLKIIPNDIPTEAFQNIIERLEKHLEANYGTEIDNPIGTFGVPILTNRLMIFSSNDYAKYSNVEDYVKYCISFYFEFQRDYVMNAIGLLKSIISKRRILLKSDQIKELPILNINWKGTDTDLLELITALVENKSIALNDNKISRKDAIRIFEQIFSIEIKDAESKLSRATDRKMNYSPFLTSLKDAFDNYCKDKIDKDKLK